MQAVIAELWRYPVKSMAGEQLDSAVIEARGVAGDRLWAIHDSDGKLGSGKSSRRFRKMAQLRSGRASYDAGVPTLSATELGTLRGPGPLTDAALSAWVGRPVSLAREEEGGVAHFDDAPIHLVTTAAIAHVADLLPDVRVDARRFRPNIVLAVPDARGPVEHGWVGHRIAVGAVLLEITHGTERCVMVSAAEADLEEEPAVLRTIAAHDDLLLGVYARVVVPGEVHVGDAAQLR